MSEPQETGTEQRDPFEFGLHQWVVENATPGPLPDANRGSWYCPTVTESQAEALAAWCRRESIGRVYDLGAGDLRLSIWLDRRGFDVTPYETITDITESVSEVFDTSGIDIRSRDYYADWPQIQSERAAFVAFGAENKLPEVPEEGIAIQGYSEIGFQAWIDGADASELWMDMLTAASSGGLEEQKRIATDAGTEQRGPTDDPRACSLCGVHIGMLGDDYCDPCAREIGAKPPMERCMHCGRDGPREQMEAVDVSAEDEYYPEIQYLCGSCSGGWS